MQKRSNRLALRVLSTATFLAMVSSCATAAFAGTYYMEDGSISIVAKTDGNYITQGTTINDQKDAGETVITNHDSETASKNTVTIKAEEDCTANVTLKDVNIDTADKSKATVTVTGNGTTSIELDGKNTLTSGTGHAGLEKNDNTGNGTLIIKDDKNDDGTEKTEEQKKAETESGKGAGSLTATGGAGGAGIGGANNQSSSNITITGGNITATAGSNSGTRLVYCGAGIGGGNGGIGENIKITDGTVNATGGWGGAGIGGGDGGCVRELCRYKHIEHIDLVEIDERVVAVCKEYLPGVACSLDDPRVHILYQDGLKYIRRIEDEYDLIIIDSTDPFGPGEGLFTMEFYGNCYKALHEHGVLVNQHESPFYRGDALACQRAHRNIVHSFELSRLFQAHIPTYPSGHWLFGFSSRGVHPVRDLDPDWWNSLGLETGYYNTNLHKGAFYLPNYVQKLLEKVEE